MNNLICKLGLHLWKYAPNGMLRRCSLCKNWQVNRNLSSDPDKKWAAISEYGRKKLIEDWHGLGKLL